MDQDFAWSDHLRVVFASYKVPIILGAVSAFCISLSVVLLVKSIQRTTPIQFSDDNMASDSAAVAGESVVLVDVEGAVVIPGVYSLPGGSRVEDAIKAAGGLTDGADLELLATTINRATKIVDGGKIVIPKIETSHNIDCATSNTDVAQSCAIVTTSKGQSQNSAFVSVNLASEAQLDSLPGVGPVTAKKIIDNRPYQTLDELVAKKAIGTSLFEKIKNNLSL